eukprot:9477467-Pyramimonas_sp.AAC.2
MCCGRMCPRLVYAAQQQQAVGASTLREARCPAQCLSAVGWCSVGYPTRHGSRREAHARAQAVAVARERSADLADADWLAGGAGRRRSATGIETAMTRRTGSADQRVG